MAVKVFISVGMRGRSMVDVEADIVRAKKYILEFVSKDAIIVDNWDCEAPDNAGRLWYLGEAIKKLGDCNICYFVKGWENYKGCRAEKHICDLYGIRTIFEA